MNYLFECFLKLPSTLIFYMRRTENNKKNKVLSKHCYRALIKNSIDCTHYCVTKQKKTICWSSTNICHVTTESVKTQQNVIIETCFFLFTRSLHKFNVSCFFVSLICSYPLLSISKNLLEKEIILYKRSIPYVITALSLLL